MLETGYWIKFTNPALDQDFVKKDNTSFELPGRASIRVSTTSNKKGIFKA
jgi:hypothetical protein